MTEDDFVAAVTEGQPTRPHYFSFDAQQNRSGHRLLDETLSPTSLSLSEVLDRVATGAVALDTREPADYAAGHLQGAVNVGLHGRFAEFAGDVLDPDREIVLVGDPATTQESTVRLARIGFDRVAGYLDDPHQLLMDRPDLVEVSSRVTIEQLAELLGLIPEIQLVDVRNPGEAALGTLSGARVIPLAVPVDSLDQLDRDAPVVVNCAGGYRSMIATSVLRHCGFRDVSDLIGGYGAWTAAGLPIATRTSTPKMAVEVTPMGAADLISSGAVIIDVREPDEWSAGHASEARLIPMAQIQGRLQEIRTDEPTVIVCRSGGRSNTIAQLLSSRGINAVNLSGGMLAWEQASLPLVTDTGYPGRII